MTGVITTAYQLLEGSDKLNTKAVTEEEGNFVLRKLDWALTGINPATTPVIGGSGCFQTLSVTKTDTAINPVFIRLHTLSGINYVEITERGIMSDITTNNASTTCLQFGLISGTPLGITATTTINGINFTITKYLRK